ncbi:hypothetical protein ACFOEK_11385 [Litoribrevibacter euphylliae]|uniref:Phytanoyl-CoA dioxygenase n=1 Tax=Litoribrevibacter euphylliae TaxID=1834034 RepID=A0ABV7HFZ2_9GAMM
MSAEEVQVKDVGISSIDPDLERLFNQSLRAQLEQLTNPSCDGSINEMLVSHCCTLVDSVLSDTELAHEKWVDLFFAFSDALLTIYKQTELTEEEINTSYLNATGLVMAVKDAVHTVKDIYRVKAFLRGLDQALTQATSQGKPDLHIVYPACGPFAPLALPLICYLNEKKPDHVRLKLTLIDIQPGAIKVLRRVADSMSLSDDILEILCMDVMDYTPSRKIDVLVIEALQHGLTREGHMSFIQHLSQFLAIDALLLPEEIKVNAILAVGQKEYCDQWRGQERSHSSFVDTDIQNDRINLGTILTLNRETLMRLQRVPLGEGFDLLEAGQVLIPKDVSDIDQRILLLAVTAKVFGEEWVNEYDSGITHPRPDMSVCIDFKPRIPEADDLLVKSGDTLKFYYKLCGTPSFLPTLA